MKQTLEATTYMKCPKIYKLFAFKPCLLPFLSNGPNGDSFGAGIVESAEWQLPPTCFSIYCYPATQRRNRGKCCSVAPQSNCLQHSKEKKSYRKLLNLDYEKQDILVLIHHADIWCRIGKSWLCISHDEVQLEHSKG